MRGGARQRRLFDVGGMDVAAVDDQHVLDAPDDEELSAVTGAEIAGAKPACAVQRAECAMAVERIAPIAVADAVAPHQDFADAAFLNACAVPRIANADFGAGDFVAAAHDVDRIRIRAR